MGWLNHAVLVCLAISVSLCAYLAFAQAAADRNSRQQTPEGIRRAIWWEPWNSDYYAQLARALEWPLKEGDLPEIVRSYEKAVHLSPHNAEYWDRLGQAYEWAGRAADAQNAHERAALLFPSSPAMNWTIGQLLPPRRKNGASAARVQKGHPWRPGDAAPRLRSRMARDGGRRADCA